MSLDAIRRRILFQSCRPNALYEEWIAELLEEAVQNRSRLEPMLCAAYNSLRRYPLPLRSGADCSILQGFHKNLCRFLDKRYKIFESILGDEVRFFDPDERLEFRNIHDAVASNPSIVSLRNLGTVGPMRRRTPGRLPRRYFHYYFQNLVPKPYIHNSSERAADSDEERYAPNISNSNTVGPSSKPRYRSAEYAILLTLLKHSQSGIIRSMPKSRLMQYAQQYCNESFTVPQDGTTVTAWSNMRRLIRMGLVSTNKTTMEYALTNEGKNMAIELLMDIADSRGTGPPYQAEQVRNSKITFPQDSFQIILLIDKNETGGSSNRLERTVELINRCSRLKHEFRRLNVGDYTWVARNRVNQEEFVLPFIVERKRMDDLAASIKDGRFHEQKFRLHKCGITNVFYLVEDYGKNKNLGLPLPSMKQALANTRVQDGFKILESECLAHTVRLLSLLTSKLIAHYDDKALEGRDGPPEGAELMTYKYFKEISAKNKLLSVRELFIKQLLQLKGLSVEKALAITNQFGTPLLLHEEYKKLSAEDGQMLLADLAYGELNRKVGPCVSKAVYQLFTNNPV